MSYSLYIAENCHECQQVIASIENLPIEIKKHNVDIDGVKTPIPIFVYPALFKDNILLAYGSDIVTYLLKRLK